MKKLRVIIVLLFILNTFGNLLSVSAQKTGSIAYGLLKQFNYYNDRSVDSCISIHKHFVDLNNNELQWIDLYLQAKIQHIVSNYDSAVVLFDSAIALLGENKFPKYENRVLLDAGFSNSLNYNVEQAISFYFQALDGFIANNNKDRFFMD